MEPCVAWVWASGAERPARERLVLRSELALDRELLGVTDSSVSRTENAPRLSTVGSNRGRLVVPPRCATGAVVVHTTDFQTLQRGLPSQEGSPQLEPAALGRSSRLVFGQHSSLALLRSVHSPGCVLDHLISLPRAERVAAGTEVILAAPALIVVGSGVVALLSGLTASPPSAIAELEAPRSFRLPTVGITLAATQELDTLASPRQLNQVRVAGYPEPFQPADLPAIGRCVLTHLQRHYAFVPALLEEREPRLVLFYERADGSVGGKISAPNIEQWLRQVEGLLLRTERELPSAGSVFTTATVGVSAPVGAAAAAQVRSGSIATGPVAARHTTAPPPELLAAPVLESAVGFGGVLTHEQRFAEVLAELQKVAGTDLGILLLGESGTGKEHLARAIHAASKRATKPFVAINCSAVPEALIESELFGHQKGAFTGTQADRDGAFASAEGGTLLLDEIGDAPLRVQLALLRVLETRSVKPVGADRERRVNVRVLAATSQDVQQLIAQQRFREDLYFRLAEFTLTLPPLRERAADLALLSKSLLAGMDCAAARSLTPLSVDALALLSQQRWPGNIRELRNALKRAAYRDASAEVLDSKCFLGLESAEPNCGIVFGARRIEFSSFVRSIGVHLWRESALPALPIQSPYERRAIHRSALIYLQVMHGRASFPAPLEAQWTQLFSARWATTESERGLKAVLKTLGLNPRDAAARAWLLSVVGLVG